jgi:hypothetical protein
MEHWRAILIVAAIVLMAFFGLVGWIGRNDGHGPDV